MTPDEQDDLNQMVMAYMLYRQGRLDAGTKMKYDAANYESGGSWIEFVERELLKLLNKP